MTLRQGTSGSGLWLWLGRGGGGQGVGGRASAGGDFVDLFFGYVRPCDHASTISSSTVHQIQFIDSGWIFLLCVQRRVPTVQTVQLIVEIPQVPLLDRFLTCPVIVQRRCAVRGVKVVDTSVVAQMQFPLVLLFRKPLRFSSCSSLIRFSMSIVQVQQFSGAVGEETVELPQLQAVEQWTLSLPCPSLCNESCRVVQTSENREGPAVAVRLNVVDVPVLHVVIGFVYSWTSSLTCPLCSTTVLLRTVKVLQIQFIAGVCGHSCCATETGTQLSAVTVMSAMKVFSAFLGHLSRSSRLSGVEGQFPEP